MPDTVLIPALAAKGITVTYRGESATGLQSCYYCLGGPNFERQGQWVTVTTADNDATKQAAIELALSV